MKFSLAGKIAFVTGSSRGIGRSIALTLAEAGAKLVLHGIKRGDAAAATLRDVAALGGEPIWVEGDLAMEGGRPLGERVLEATGGVDILVLNASIQKKIHWSEVDPLLCENHFRANFQASLELIQVLAPAMQEKRWGRIVTIGSVQQSRGNAQMLVYAATKVAQFSMVQSLCKTLAKDGVTINNLAPGIITTDRNTEALADLEYAEKMRNLVPMKFFGEADDCAGAALLLCSEEGRYITGQNFYVDGGLSS